MTSLAGEEERNLAACRGLVADEDVLAHFERPRCGQLDHEVVEVVRDERNLRGTRAVALDFAGRERTGEVPQLPGSSGLVVRGKQGL